MYIVMATTLFGFFVIPGEHSPLQLCKLCNLAFSGIRGAISMDIEPKEQGLMQGGVACVSNLSAVVGPPLVAGFFYAFTSSEINYPGLTWMAWCDFGSHWLGCLSDFHASCSGFLNVIAFCFITLSYVKYDSTRLFLNK